MHVARGRQGLLGERLLLLADYACSRSFDTYVGVMAMQYKGRGLVKHPPTDAFLSSNGMYSVGVRYRF